eukprot:TRINITY_DN165_c2_g2_i1.p1 TRINITY_DN165_c2_g2~~TRINITY_DN165_c2_g2_i1.p1  ORF type:complete len:1301 (-),score=237.49 TRINITY_DN165_c2_g2_i1:27-3929(-)
MPVGRTIAAVCEDARAPRRRALEFIRVGSQVAHPTIVRRFSYGASMATCLSCCFGRGRSGGGDHPAAPVSVSVPAFVSLGQSSPVANNRGSRATLGVDPDAALAISSSTSSAGFDTSEDNEKGRSPVATSGSAGSLSVGGSREFRSIDGVHPQPSAAAAQDTSTMGDAVSRGGSAGAATQGSTSGDALERVGGRDNDNNPTSGGGAGEGAGKTVAGRGRGYPIVTFRVHFCASDTRAVVGGTEVHACLGRSVHVLWHTPRRGVPTTEDDFRRAGPARIRVERGGVGALRAASADEAAAVGVPPADDLLFLRGTEVSSAGSGQALSAITLLLQAPTATVCTAWTAAGSSLLTPLVELLAVAPDGNGDATCVRDLLHAVLPPLPVAAGDQPNVVSRILGCRGRRFVLNSHNWLTPSTPGAPALASVIRKTGDAIDEKLPVPAVGPALRLGLLVVQVGALAVLADGDDTRRDDAVGRCEGVACDLLGRIFQELRGAPTEFSGAYVKQLCSQMERVEAVLEDVEGVFFLTPVKAALTSGAAARWEQQLNDICKEQTNSHVQGAVGRTVDRVEIRLDGLQKKMSTLGRSLAPQSVNALDLSDYEVRWRPPVLGGDYVEGVASPGRAEHTIISMLERWTADGRIDAPRVGICAIGGSGKSTACAGVAACPQVRALFPLGTTWVQLNESSSRETLSTAAVALVYRFCGPDDARRLLQLAERADFLAVAARYLRANVVADASNRLVIIDDVLDCQADLMEQMLLVVPSVTPVLFTTRSETVVASVTGAEQVTLASLPEGDARELLAKAIDRKPTADEPVFSEIEEVELVRPVLQKTQRHALSLGIVAALIKARGHRWRLVVKALEDAWLDTSFARPLGEMDPRRSVRGTLDMSRKLLPNDTSRAAFQAVGILPANELVGADVLERLWRPHLDSTAGPTEGGCSSHLLNRKHASSAVHPGVDELVDTLVRAGLLHREVADGDLAGVVVHPVICGYARMLLGDDYCATNERLVDEYFRECPAVDAANDGWYVYNFWSRPDDGYWYNHVARHAAACGNLQVLVSLMADAWKHARQGVEHVYGYQADVELVLAYLRTVIDDVGHKVWEVPVLLGAVHWGVAAAYLRCNGSKTADTWEEVVTLLSDGLKLVRQAEARMQWGEMQNDLGNAYLSRVVGDKAANVQEALSCYRRALEVRTQDGAPRGWAETQCCMADLYLSGEVGGKTAAVEQALACHQGALKVRTRQASPWDWAHTQLSMARAYIQRIIGEKEANIEDALACFRRALEVCTRDAAPEQWAWTSDNWRRGRVRGT